MKISVVLLEYFSVDEIFNAVNTIRKYDCDCEIIVSSNSQYSIEKQCEVKRAVSGVKWVFNDENGGFGYGMTMGAKVASEEYIVFLNSDVILHTDFQGMVNYMENNPKVGIIAPELVDDKGVVQDSYRKTVTPFNFVLRHIARLLRIQYQYKKLQPIIVDWVIGAFMLTKKSYFEMVGGFDYKTYFMYVEDMDLCHEFKLMGFDTVYYPMASAQYVGTRAARYSMKYAKIHLQSLLMYWKKNFLRKRN